MKPVSVLCIAAFLTGCATAPTPPSWEPDSKDREAEYAPYLKQGSATVFGQAFLTQSGGAVVKAAGRSVTLDPATSVGKEWWGKAGKMWVFKDLTPSSPNFFKARKETVADAEGRFKFTNVAAGQYYVRTEVTWEIGGGFPTQGGLVGRPITVEEGLSSEVILNRYPE